MYDSRNIRRVIIAGLLLAITLLLAFTRIGFIPVPTPAANATIVHIPAIVGGILEGTWVGMVIGLGFGFASFLQATIPAFKDPLVAIVPRLFIGIVASLVFSSLYRSKKQTLYTVIAALTALVLAVVLVLSGIFPNLLADIRSLSQETAGVTAFKWWQSLIVGCVVVILAFGLIYWLHKEDIGIVATALAAAAGSLTNTVLVLGMATLRGYFTAGMSLMIGLAQGIPEMIVSIIVTVAIVAAVRQFGRRKARL